MHWFAQILVQYTPSLLIPALLWQLCFTNVCIIILGGLQEMCSRNGVTLDLLHYKCTVIPQNARLLPLKNRIYQEFIRGWNHHFNHILTFPKFFYSSLNIQRISQMGIVSPISQIKTRKIPSFEMNCIRSPILKSSVWT